MILCTNLGCVQVTMRAGRGSGGDNDDMMLSTSFSKSE